MISRTHLIEQVCKELEIPCRLVDENEIVFQLTIQNRPRYIHHNSFGLNRDSDAKLSRDKDYQYRILQDTNLMPVTKNYLDPECEYATQSTLSREQIASDIQENFLLPVIIKKNSGTEGVHVFRANSASQIARAIKIIFNPRHKYYDHVLIVQPWIEPKREYRVVILDGHIEFVYTKSFITDQSSLKSADRWQTAKAELITNEDTLQKLRALAETMYATWPIRYTGLDVIEDTNGKMWLIEVNSAPLFTYFLRDNGPELVKKLFTKIFQKMQEE